MNTMRTDLAVEAHELWKKTANGRTLPGIETEMRERHGCRITAVEVTEEQTAAALGKPKGNYVTLDLRLCGAHDGDAPQSAAMALAEELRLLIGKMHGRGALVVGLGNRAMTPDAIGPLAAEQIFVTRHLRRESAFASLVPVSVLIPGVLGRTGVEAFELVRGAVHTVQPEVLIVVDALASQRLGRVCTTIQLSDTGIVPGSGVGNHRHAIDRAALGIPVIAVGVPTVVDANTLALDVIEEAGVPNFDPRALRGQGSGVMVTPRDVDAQIRDLARICGFGINLALQPQLDFAQLMQLLG